MVYQINSEVKNILREHGILRQVDTEIMNINKRVEKESKLPIYIGMSDPEDIFISIAPCVLYELIKKDKIDYEKINQVTDILKEKYSDKINFRATLLIITGYILERNRKPCVININ